MRYCASWRVAPAAVLGHIMPAESIVAKEFVRSLVMPSTPRSERRCGRCCCEIPNCRWAVDSHGARLKLRLPLAFEQGRLLRVEDGCDFFLTWRDRHSASQATRLGGGECYS